MKQGNGTILIMGETLVDFFFASVSHTEAGHKHFHFMGAPGGAPSNVAANLADMGLPVSVITSFSDDELGSELKQVLLERNIDIGFSSTHPGGKTPIAVVLRSPDGDRDFRLYLTGSVLESIDTSTVRLTEDITFFHCGSIHLVFEAGVRATWQLLAQLAEGSAIRSYDINIRPDILKDYPQASAAVMEMLKHIDVLKLSDQDLQWIQKHVDPSLRGPEDYLKLGIKLVAYTLGADGAVLLTPSTSCLVPAPDVDVVDTTGGGDAFMAGILAGLYERGITRRDALASLDDESLRAIGLKASDCAGRIISQEGGMPPLRG